MTSSSFTTESWTWYGFVITMVILRFVARLLHFKSVLRLQVEDWLMLFVTCLYTILVVFLNIDETVSTNLINPADIPNLTPQDISQRRWGSKMVLLVEQCMCAVQWGTKACLLVLYWRLTQNLRQNMIVKCVAAYVATTYVVMEVLYFGYWCRPFHDYWQTPTDNVQCTTALHHLIMNLSFNLSSDLMLISIPLFLLVRTKMDRKRKFLLVFPFSLGFLTIICAILSKHLSFAQPFSVEWVFWYCREASTAMIVTNMPYTWSLIRRVFGLHSFIRGSNTDRKGSTIQGISPIETSSGASQAQVRHRSSRIFPGRKGGKNSTSDASVESEMHMNGWPGQVGVEIKSEVKTAVDSSNSTSSGDDCISRPLPSGTTAALDKLYPVDDDELDLIEEKENERRRRTTLGE